MRRESKLGDLLAPVLKQLHLDKAVKEHLAVMLWPEVVGATNARHSRALRVRQGVLSVATRSSAWAQELDLLKSDILARLNRRLGVEQPGEEVIRDIRFSSSGPPPTRGEENSSRGQQDLNRPKAGSSRERGGALLPTTPEAVSLPRHTILKIEQMVEKVGDPELKRLLERALISLQKTADWKGKRGWKTCAGCGCPHSGRNRYCPRCERAGHRSGADRR